MRIAAAALSLLLLGCWPWHLAYSQEAFTVPHEARVWKRQWLGTMRQIWGLDVPAWTAAQIGQESGWVDGLVSSSGARGLAQFIGPTAEGMERQYPGLASLGRYSPRWSFYSNGLLMRELFREFSKGRDRCNGIKFSGGGYVGSPSTLRKEISLCAADWPRCDSRLWDENVAVKNARAVNHWRDSRNYVFRISQRENVYALSGYGVEYCKK